MGSKQPTKPPIERESCPTCKGSGIEPEKFVGMYEVVCQTCSGRGWIGPFTPQPISPPPPPKKTCPHCGKEL